MEKSTKMAAVVAVFVLAVAAATSAEARNIKTTEAASKDAVVQPQTFPPFDRFGSASPAFGGLPGSSIPGFSLPGSSGSSIPGFSLPGSSGITPGFGSIPFLGGFGGGSPGLGGMPGSPAAAVDEHAKKP